MRRLFPILALATGLFLIGGLVASGGVAGPLQWLEFASIVWTHAFAAIYLESTGRRVEVMAESAGLPDWVRAQAEKNRHKLLFYLWIGLPLFPILFLLEGKGLVVGPVSVGLLALNLAFQVGSFVGEFAIMAAQARLVGDVEVWVTGRGRLVA